MLKSQIIKEGIREFFENGTSEITDKTCYGYSKAPDGSLTINNQEAKIVVSFLTATFPATVQEKSLMRSLSKK